jgi:hypothetical protein
MDVRPVAVAVVAASLAAAAPAAAQDPLEVRGVRAENVASGGVMIVFTSRGPSAPADGRPADHRPLPGGCPGRSPARAGRPRGRAVPGHADPACAAAAAYPARPGSTFDVCQLTAVRGVRAVRSLTLPVTPAGAAYLAAKRVGDRLVAALAVASGLGPDGHYPAAEDVVVPGLVVLAAPTDTPPPRRVGLYSDAAAHMTVVATTADSRRLFIDADGGVLTSNVPELVLARR